MKFIPLFAALLLSAVAFAKPAPLSAKRGPNESYLDAVARIRSRSLSQLDGTLAFGPTAYDARVSKISDLDGSVVAEIANLETLQQIFETYRDLRFVPDPGVDGFVRRLSWMYPDDGCFARAELFGFLAEKDHQPSISKIFVFGDLSVETSNHPRGSVSWWYHVAPLYRMGQELYVMDPAVEPQHPITRAEWAQRIGERGAEGETSLEWSICSAHSFDPSSKCHDASAPSEASAISSMSYYLSAERYRMTELKRDVDQVLGDYPPWLMPISAGDESVSPPAQPLLPN